MQRHYFRLKMCQVMRNFIVHSKCIFAIGSTAYAKFSKIFLFSITCTMLSFVFWMMEICDKKVFSFSEHKSCCWGFEVHIKFNTSEAKMVFGCQNCYGPTVRKRKFSVQIGQFQIHTKNFRSIGAYESEKRNMYA